MNKQDKMVHLPVEGEIEPESESAESSKLYRCEWRIDISAETPEQAVTKAEELMRAAWLSCWTVIDEHGHEQNFDVPALTRLPAPCVCQHDSDDVCEAQCPESSLLCTREKGHDGHHVACSSEQHVAARWALPQQRNTA